MVKPKGEFDGVAWTLPKGKMDKAGEHPVETALREVEQETGIDGAIIGLVPGQYKGKTGTSNYFMMKSQGFDASKLDGETEDYAWVDFAEAQKLLAENKNKEAAKRDFAAINKAMSHHADLLSGKATNNYLLKPKSVTLTDLNLPILEKFSKQSTSIGMQHTINTLKNGGRGVVIIDTGGKLKAIAAYNDADDDRIEITTAASDSITSGKTLLITTGKIAAGQGKGVVVPRGAVESTSIFGAVYIHGSTEVTLQRVPLHRVIAPYFLERSPGSGQSMFLGDDENEFVVILGDLPFDYVATNGGREVVIQPGLA